MGTEHRDNPEAVGHLLISSLENLVNLAICEVFLQVPCACGKQESLRVGLLQSGGLHVLCVSWGTHRAEL